MIPQATAFILTCCMTILGAPLSMAQDTKEDIAQSLQEPLVAGRDLGSQLPQYSQTALHRHPFDRQVFAANCESDPGWWGQFCVFHQAGGIIDWVAKAPPLYHEWEGHYIPSLNWWHLDNLDMDVLQVITSTHMGNGLLWIFALEGRELRPLLRAPGCGFADSPALIAGLPDGEAKLDEPVEMEFKTPPGGEAETLQLTFKVVVREPNSDTVLARRTTIQTWLWDSKERIFRLHSSK